jgi:hypothetical protein
VRARVKPLRLVVHVRRPVVKVRHILEPLVVRVRRKQSRQSPGLLDKHICKTRWWTQAYGRIRCGLLKNHGGVCETTAMGWIVRNEPHRTLPWLKK